MTVYAAEEKAGGYDYTITNGTVDFGQGKASITIKGNAGQSLAGKSFEVFRLFDAENAKGGESINYTFNANSCCNGSEQERWKQFNACGCNRIYGYRLYPDFK